MKKFWIYCNLVFWGLWSGCSEWNDHYKTVQNAMEELDMGVLEYLQREGYNDLSDLLKATAADTLFGKEVSYTVWAAPDGKYSAVKSLGDSLRRATVRHQLTEGKYFETTLSDGFILRSLAGKMQLFSEPLAIEGISVVKLLANCKDGLVYEIREPMPIQPNLWEYLQQRPAYSKMVALLLSDLDTVFDPDVSRLTGKYDSEDLPIYDSVWVVQPTVFGYSPINKERRQYSVFVADNALLQEVLDEYYDNKIRITGFPATKTDTINLENWLKRSFIINERIEEYNEEEYYSSAWGVRWYTRTQLVDAGRRQTLSNGYFYPLTRLVIPNKYLQPGGGFSNFASISFDADPASVTYAVHAEDIDQLSVKGPAKTQVAGAIYSMSLLAELSSGYAEEFPPFDLELSWIATTRDEETLASSAVQIPPGEYQVNITYYKSLEYQSDFDLYINDIRVGKVNTEAGLWNVQNTVVVSRVKLPQESKVGPLKVTLKSLSDSWQKGLAPVSISLIPTNNND